VAVSVEGDDPAGSASWDASTSEAMSSDDSDSHVSNRSCLGKSGDKGVRAYAISNTQNWVMGESLKRVVAALQAERRRKGSGHETEGSVTHFLDNNLDNWTTYACHTWP
jgi:hypothetical protein